MLITILLFTSSCGQGRKEQVTVEPNDTSNVTQADKIFPIENVINKSFVISCGSGCAMRYTAKDILRNNSSIKVKFEVEMYIDEVVTDTFFESYVFIYNETSNKISRILDENNKSIQEQLPQDAQVSFINFGNELINNVNESNDNECFIVENNVKLPYKEKIDIDNVIYKINNCKDSEVENSYYCDGERYIPLIKKGDFYWLLFPMDCGDFPYRFYLSIIKSNKIISELYVEGEWYDMAVGGGVETTSFEINTDYSITVTTTWEGKDTMGTDGVKKYKVSDDGKIVEVKE